MPLSPRSVTFRFLRGGLLAGALVLSLSACNKDAPGTTGDGETDDQKITYTLGAPIADSSIVAVVESEFGRDTLRADLFRNQLAAVLQRNPALAGDTTQLRELRRSLVEGFVLESLVTGEMMRNDSLRVDTAMVNQQIQAFIAQAGGEENFARQLAADNLTVDSLRSLLGRQMRQQALIEAWSKSATTPSAQDIEVYRNEQAQEVRVQHIVWLDRGFSTAQRDSLTRVANAVLDSAKAGKISFADLARRHSQDGTATTGGTLDYFNRQAQMDQKFVEAAFDLAADEDSGAVANELVKSQFGYHVIRLTGERMGTPMDTTMARARLMDERASDAIRARLKELVAQRKVVVYLNQALVKADLNSPLDPD